MSQPSKQSAVCPGHGRIADSTAALRILCGASLLLILGACGGDDDPAVLPAPPAPPSPPTSVSVSDAPARCASLANASIPPDAFALPTGGAIVSEALLIEADPAAGAPAYCRLRGRIVAINSADPPINFQINLPQEWNLKTVQFGGSGQNQVLVQASGAFVNAGSSIPTALARNYVTYGSDSGNVVASGSFYDNTQAWLNYAHESVKRNRDLASAVVTRYYGTLARRNYHIGGSKGGQEALQAVQRYGDDFDGAVAYYPAARQQSLQLSWNRSWQYAFNTPGGSLNTAKQALLKTAVQGVCDPLDGAADGIVSNVLACSKAFDVEALRCAGGSDNGDACLSATQIATLNAMATPFHFAFPMVNNVTSVGPWPAYLGGDLSTLFGDGSAPGSFYRQTVARPEAMQSTGIAYGDWVSRVERFSAFDASNPDIDAFRARGGKLLLVHGTNDMLVPTSMTTSYVNALSERYGRSALKDFVRYYIVPGFGHGNGDFRMQWDALAALDAWIEEGKAPTIPVAVDGAVASAGRTRPMCEYPMWPKYRGTGDLNSADSFICAEE